MFDFGETKLVSIAPCETFFRKCEDDEMVEWHHSFLSLVDETKDVFDPDRVVDNLHVTTGYRNIFSVRTGRHRTVEDFKDTKMFDAPPQTLEDVRNDWLTLKEFFNSLPKQRVYFGRDYRFSPTANNCRTAVRDGLKLIGRELTTDQIRSDAGMLAPSLI